MTFTLNAGETLAIVGESGSGKSVTALSINRLIDYSGGRITSGRIDLSLADGNKLDLATLDTGRMERIRGSEIGMIFQEPMTSLNPVLTIGRQIEEVFRLQGKGGQRRVPRHSARSIGCVFPTQRDASATIRTSFRAECCSG